MKDKSLHANLESIVHEAVKKAYERGRRDGIDFMTKTISKELTVKMPSVPYVKLSVVR